MRSSGQAVLVSVVVGLELVWIAYVVLASIASPSFGLDYTWHMDASRRLLETGTPYWPWQIADPYVIGNGAILYPATAFVLFIPFLWLPTVLWWVVPIVITAVGMTRHRPPVWVWPIALGLFCLPSSLNVYVFGNPTMWLVAAVAAGTAWSWPFALVVVKPTFSPLMLLGIRHRSWWIDSGRPVRYLAAVRARVAGLGRSRAEFGRVRGLQRADAAACSRSAHSLDR